MPSRIVVITNDNAELSYNMNDTKFMGSFIEDLIELCDDDVLKVSVPFSKNDFIFFYDDYTSKRYSFICTPMGAFFNNGIDYLNNILNFTNLWNCSTSTSISNSSVYKMFNKFCDNDDHFDDIRDYVADRHNCSFGVNSIHIHDEDDTRCFYVHDFCNVLMHVGVDYLSIYPRKKVNNNKKIRWGNDDSDRPFRIYTRMDNTLICLYESGQFIYYSGHKIYYLTFVKSEILVRTYIDATKIASTDSLTNMHNTLISSSIISHIYECIGYYHSKEAIAYLLTMIPNMYIFELPNYCDKIRIDMLHRHHLE